MGGEASTAAGCCLAVIRDTVRLPYKQSVLQLLNDDCFGNASHVGLGFSYWLVPGWLGNGARPLELPAMWDSADEVKDASQQPGEPGQLAASCQLASCQHTNTCKSSQPSSL